MENVENRFGQRPYQNNDYNNIRWKANRNVSGLVISTCKINANIVHKQIAAHKAVFVLLFLHIL